MRAMIFLFFLFINLSAFSQQQVASIPFEFEKGSSKNKEYGTYYLIDKDGENISFILKDNTKISYLLLDKKMKLIKRLDNAGLVNTPFADANPVFCNGSSNGMQFNYIFQLNKEKEEPKFFCNTVNFQTGSITSKLLFTKLKSENILNIFSANGEFFHLSTIDSTDELKIRKISSTGELIEKKIRVVLPSRLNRSKLTLTRYLEDAVIILDEKSISLEEGRYKRKIYFQNNKLRFVINWTCHSTHIFSVDTENFSIKNLELNPFDHEMEYSKTTPMINSVLFDGKLFSLITYTDKLQVSVHDLETSKLIKTIEVNKDFDSDYFREAPINVTRFGRYVTQKNTSNWNKEFKNMFEQDDAIFVTKNDLGQYELTFGMHRAVPTDKDDGGKWTETFKFVSAYGANSRASNANLTTASRTLETTVRYSTGFPSLQYSVNYYRETRFRINLTANNFELVKGKDKPYFLDTESFVYTDKKFTKEVLPSMFTFNKIDYFNYYDRNAKAYITEKIISK